MSTVTEHAVEEPGCVETLFPESVAPEWGPFLSQALHLLTSWLWMRSSRSASGLDRFSGVRAQVSTCLSIVPRSPSSWVIRVRSF